MTSCFYTLTFLLLLLINIKFTRPQLEPFEGWQRALWTKHNELRSAITMGEIDIQPYATDMEEILYDSNLETIPLNHALKCNYGNNKKLNEKAESISDLLSFKFNTELDQFGENIAYVEKGQFLTYNSLQQVIEDIWFDEYQYYDYSKRKCDKDQTCNSYEKLLWSRTRYMACGVSICTSLDFEDGSSIPNAAFIVCNYWPSFDSTELPIYKTNNEQTIPNGICTECSNDRLNNNQCINGLCSGCPAPNYYYCQDKLPLICPSKTSTDCLNDKITQLYCPYTCFCNENDLIADEECSDLYLIAPTLSPSITPTSNDCYRLGWYDIDELNANGIDSCPDGYSLPLVDKYQFVEDNCLKDDDFDHLNQIIPGTSYQPYGIAIDWPRMDIIGCQWNTDYSKGIIPTHTGNKCGDRQQLFICLPNTLNTYNPTTTTSISIISMSSLTPTIEPTITSISTNTPTFTKSGPTYKPTNIPTTMPTTKPSMKPTTKPTEKPTYKPSEHPSNQPTTDIPTHLPTNEPTPEPTPKPTKKPTKVPTTYNPTGIPTIKPTTIPTNEPTDEPTKHDMTDPPTTAPTLGPTDAPTTEPTSDPTDIPSTLPTTSNPTHLPTLNPTNVPTFTTTTMNTTIPYIDEPFRMYFLFPDALDVNINTPTDIPLKRRMILLSDNDDANNIESKYNMNLYPSSAMSISFPMYPKNSHLNSYKNINGYGYQFKLRNYFENKINVGLSKIEYMININSCNIDKINNDLQLIIFKLFVIDKFDNQWTEIKSIKYELELMESGNISIIFNQNHLTFNQNHMFMIDISLLLKNCVNLSHPIYVKSYADLTGSNKEFELIDLKSIKCKMNNTDNECENYKYWTKMSMEFNSIKL